MDMFLILSSDDVPTGRWSMDEAKQVLEDRYPRADLQIEEDLSSYKRWVIYNWSNTDSDGHATLLPEKIIQIDVPQPSAEPIRQDVFHPNVAGGALMELTVTTPKGKASMQSRESDHTWNASALDQGLIIEHFAARAGRALADHLTKGEPR